MSASACQAGDWVEVERILLEPDDRAENLPPETATKPFTMWVKGFAQNPGLVGEIVTIETMSGRLVEGRLSAIDPGYFQTFGPPIRELTHVGKDLRARVAEYRAVRDEKPSGAGGPS